MDDHLDVFGQQPFLHRLYTQLCLCYSVPDPSPRQRIVSTLENGLERLAENFPWLAGQVVNDDGTFKIIPLEKSPRLVVKDIPELSIEELRTANFPFRILDESILCPDYATTLPDPQYASQPAPVLLVQATFITGGLLLTFITQHNCMDMTSQGHFTYLLSKACHNQPFTDEEISIGNMQRKNAIPLLDNDEQPGPEIIERYVAKPNPNPPPPAKCTWAYFTFSAKALAALKSDATKSKSDSVPFISTDDALCAFIWKAVTRARLPRLTSPQSTETTFGRAIDIRPYLSLPLKYPGVSQNMTYHTHTLHTLLDTPLGIIASQFRQALDPSDPKGLSHTTRALTTLLHTSSLESKKKISVTASLNPSTAVTLSSWANQTYSSWECDFNLGLGKPEAVRRPGFPAVAESLMYLMPRAPLPKAEREEIALGLCLRDEDLERLRSDEEWGMYARYVG